MRLKPGPWKQWQKAFCWMYAQATGTPMCRGWRRRLRRCDKPVDLLVVCMMDHHTDAIVRVVRFALGVDAAAPDTDDAGARRVMGRIGLWLRAPSLITEHAARRGWSGRVNA